MAYTPRGRQEGRKEGRKEGTLGRPSVGRSVRVVSQSVSQSVVSASMRVVQRSHGVRSFLREL